MAITKGNKEAAQAHHKLGIKPLLLLTANIFNPNLDQELYGNWKVFIQGSETNTKSDLC